jgi:hypothetical protein
MKGWLDERDEVFYNGKMLDPQGGPRWKNIIGTGMALIGQFKERKKFRSCSSTEHEQFHKQENHAYWNESYYYNGSCGVSRRTYTSTANICTYMSIVGVRRSNYYTHQSPC